MSHWYCPIHSYWNNKIHKSAEFSTFHSQECWWTNSSLTLIFHVPENPKSRQPGLLIIASVQLQKLGLLSVIIHHMQPQGKRPFLFQICLQWDPNPGVLLFRSPAALMHYHTNKNETGPCVQLSKGQKGCKAHITENPQVSYRQKMQLTPQISSDNG